MLIQARLEKYGYVIIMDGRIQETMAYLDKSLHRIVEGKANLALDLYPVFLTADEHGELDPGNNQRLMAPIRQSSLKNIPGIDDLISVIDSSISTLIPGVKLSSTGQSLIIEHFDTEEDLVPQHPHADTPGTIDDSPLVGFVSPRDFTIMMSSGSHLKTATYWTLRESGLSDEAACSIMFKDAADDILLTPFHIPAGHLLVMKGKLIHGGSALAKTLKACDYKIHFYTASPSKCDDDFDFTFPVNAFYENQHTPLFSSHVKSS